MSTFAIGLAGGIVGSCIILGIAAGLILLQGPRLAQRALQSLLQGPASLRRVRRSWDWEE